MEFGKELQIANISQFEKTLKRVHTDKNIKSDSLIDNLLNEDITLHWGGMSDPFQPIEEKLEITKQLIDIMSLLHNKTTNYEKIEQDEITHLYNETKEKIISLKK